ncbi:hypothetical protein GBF38_015300 [Nibea albiflora]|uniref:Uncharacterized protein n=1 Tax=Nibea albiflora TaxID=240163 RepID=A0ACB7EKW0_NIBAL|nr:hypothetical protein GBF38_015300 [Nibea albiflora]
MEARPKDLLSNVLHSWGSAGVGSRASCSHMFSADSLRRQCCTNFLIGVDKLKIGRLISVARETLLPSLMLQWSLRRGTVDLMCPDAEHAACGVRSIL